MVGFVADAPRANAIRGSVGDDVMSECTGGLGKGKLSVVGYTDADFAGDLDRWRSTSGYLYTFAASDSCKESIWLTRLVGDLGIVGEIPVLHCDNQSAIELAWNPVFHAKTKHVDVRYHFIRGVLEDKHLQLVKVHTDDNPTNLLMKSLSSERFAHLRELMGIG
ncbi:hypothetical protein L7F22_001273 [Adiantum nelumboides]|nr:hypothetical protein [Adiantum nelumboides]